MTRRLTVLSVGRARAAWPRDVARWATAGLLAVDHHPCLSPSDLEARLAEAARPDVVMLDGGLSDTGRDLIRRSAERGSAVLVIDDHERAWRELGASAVAPAPSDPETLRRLLDKLRPAAEPTRTGGELSPTPGRSTLIAVTGHGGSGVSTIAGMLAHRWAELSAGAVLLADLSLRADQHVHHALIDTGSGVLGLVAGQERSTMDGEAVRGCATATGRPHQLLTGLRRPREWTALAPTAVEAALHALAREYDLVVADVDDDLEGRAETGSGDLEERNALTRTAVRQAAAVVFVARADMLGLHRLCQHLEALTAFDVDAERVNLVLNGIRRRPPTASSLRRDLDALVGAPFGDRPVVTVPHSRGLEARRRDGRPPSRRLRERLRPLDGLATATGPQQPSPPEVETVGARSPM